MTAADEQGIIRLRSAYSVAETLDRLEASLEQRAVLVFARIDFSGDAARAGLALRPEQLLIFGNPKGGTPLLAAQPGVGLDLPLKALAWEDVDGQVWIAYNDPLYIVQRHGVAAALAANLAAVTPLIEHAAQKESGTQAR